MKRYGFSPGSSTSTVERMSHEAEEWLKLITAIRLDVQPLPEDAMRELRHANALIDQIGNAVFDKEALNACVEITTMKISFTIMVNHYQRYNLLLQIATTTRHSSSVAQQCSEHDH